LRLRFSWERVTTEQPVGSELAKTFENE